MLHMNPNFQGDQRYEVNLMLQQEVITAASIIFNKAFGGELL